MKKKLSRWTALALTLGAALCFAAGAAAADTLQTITAYLDAGITVTLDGEVQTLKDGSGTRIYPISYNGSTYLPSGPWPVWRGLRSTGTRLPGLSSWARPRVWI